MPKRAKQKSKKIAIPVIEPEPVVQTPEHGYGQFEALPYEVTLLILAHLSVRDLVQNMSVTCQEARRLCLDNQLWAPHWEATFDTAPPLVPSICAKYAEEYGSFERHLGNWVILKRPGVCCVFNKNSRSGANVWLMPNSCTLANMTGVHSYDLRTFQHTTPASLHKFVDAAVPWTVGHCHLTWKPQAETLVFTSRKIFEFDCRVERDSDAFQDRLALVITHPALRFRMVLAENTRGSIKLYRSGGGAFDYGYLYPDGQVWGSALKLVSEPMVTPAVRRPLLLRRGR
jgi:hypothetical protein